MSMTSSLRMSEKERERIQAEKDRAALDYETKQAALGLYRDHPRPSVGQVVRWFPNGVHNEDSVGAIVTHVGYQAVSLRVFSDEISIPYKDGVCHIRHPAVAERRANAKNFSFAGCWDFTVESYELDQLKVNVKQLAEMVGKLTKPQEVK